MLIVIIILTIINVKEKEKITMAIFKTILMMSLSKIKVMSSTAVRHRLIVDNRFHVRV